MLSIEPGVLRNMVTTLWAQQALMPTGWCRDVRVEIDASGRIVAVETDAARPADGPSATMLDCVLPAPANLHSHAFQRAMAGLTEARGPDPADSFWTWRQQMYRFLDQLSPDQVQAITAFVQMEMLEAGYASVGEFHYLHHQPDGSPYDNVAEMAERVTAAAAETGIGLSLLPVLYHQGGCDGRALGAGQRRFGNGLDRFAMLHDGAAKALSYLSDDAVLGVAPHSLRAVGPTELRELMACHPSGPFHVHAAEQVAEVREVSDALSARPVQWLLDNAGVDERWCVIHATHLDDAEVAGLAGTKAVVGLCPITESSLGDGIFRGVDFRTLGGRFGVGSDSNIRIGLFEELRTLEYSQRLRDRGRALMATAERSTGRFLLDAVTAGGAQACGRDSGAIAVGQWADLVALDTGSTDLVGRIGDGVIDSAVFARGESAVAEVWSAGRHVVSGGVHREHARITARYRGVMKALMAKQ